MKIFILILWFNAAGASLDHVEFNSIESCEMAKSEYFKRMELNHWNGQYGAICAEK